MPDRATSDAAPVDDRDTGASRLEALLAGLEGTKPEYPHSVEAAIAECFPSADALDAHDFDPVAYINQQFPDENSLALMDSFTEQQASRIENLDQEIYDAVSIQAVEAQHAATDVEAAKGAIQQLFLKIKDITGRAEQSEVMVQEICRDIKQLDFAKRHLTSTITGLKRLHMFITAVDQLEFMAQSRQYNEAANLVKAVTQLSNYFSEYQNVPKVRMLRDTVAQLKDVLTKQIFEDFESIEEVSADYNSGAGGMGGVGGGSGLYGGDDDDDRAMFYASDAQTPESLAGACAVADALGEDCRRTLCRTLTGKWLKTYDRDFVTNQANSKLELTDRRYAWLRRLLNSNKDRYGAVFPEDWAMDHQIVALFCERTAAHLKTVLSTYDPPETCDVGALVRALKKTILFEREFSAKYEPERHKQKSAKKANARRRQQRRAELRRRRSDDTDTEEDLDSSSSEDGSFNDDDSSDATGDAAVMFDSEGEEIDPMSPEGIRRKHRARQKKLDGKTLDSAGGVASEAEEGGGGAGRVNVGGGLMDVHKDAQLRSAQIAKLIGDLPMIKGTISEVFDPYLIAFVKALASDILASLDSAALKEDEEISSNGSLTVFESSTMLMGKFAQATNRCTELTTGRGFFDMCLEFKRCLFRYSEILEEKVARSRKAGCANTSSAPTTAARTLSFVLNTAEYMASELPSFETHLKNKFERGFKQSLSLAKECDMFYRARRLALRGLVAVLDARVDRALGTMVKTNWLAASTPGDQSAYVSEVSATVQDYALTLRELLEPEFFQTFCGDFGMSLLPRFLQRLVQCKRIGFDGAHQLLIDTHSLKAILLELPTIGLDSEDDPPLGLETFSKLVSGFMEAVEHLLKLVGMDAEHQHVVNNFPVLLEQGSVADLKLVLELRGVKKNEMAAFVRQAVEAGVRKGGEQLFKVDGATGAGTGGTGASSSARVSGGGAADGSIPSVTSPFAEGAEAAGAAASLLNERARAAAQNFNMPSSKNKSDLYKGMSSFFESTSSSLSNITKRATTKKT